MQILSLELEDVKSYEHAAVTFTPGTNAIVGQNGAGKSTVLEAIGFALFDSLAYRQADFVREGAKSATITVTFASTLDERRYQIVRRCGSSTQYYVFDPELELKLHEGKADVQGFLRQHMGVDATMSLEKLFSDAIGVPQGTFTAAFLEGRAERKSKFDALLQVRDYEEAWSRLREPSALLRSRQQSLDVDIAGMSARLEQVPALAAAVVVRRQEILDAEKALATTKNELERVRGERAQLDGVQRELSSLREQQGQLRTSAATIQGGLDAARSQLVEAHEAVAIVEQNRVGYAAFVAAQATQSELDAAMRRRQQLRDQRSEYDKTLALAEVQARALAQSLDEISAAEGQVAALQPLVEQQVTLEEALANQERRAAEHERLEKEKRRRRQEQQELVAKHRELTAQLANAATLDERRAASQRALAEVVETLQDARQTLTTLKVSADGLKEQNQRLQDIETSRCPLCEQPLTNDHRSQLLTRNMESLSAMRVRYTAAQKEIENAQTAQMGHQQAVQELESTLRNLPRQAELHESEQALAALAEALATLEAEAKAVADAAILVPELREQLEQLGNPRQQVAVAQAAAHRRNTVQAEQQQVMAAIATAKADLQTVDEALSEFADLDQQRTTVAETLASHAAAHQAVLTHERLAATVDARTTVVDRYELEATAIGEQESELAERLKQVTADFDEERFRTLLAEEQQLVARHASLDTQVSMVRQTLAENEQRLAQLEQVQRELATVQATRDQTARVERVLEDMRGVIRQAGPFVTRALVQQIGDEAARIFGEIMQDHTRQLSWDEEYLITLNVDGNERQFSQLSGGEQMSAAIAVRLALLRHMSNIDIAFFDEPTTNLDSERRQSLAEQILKVDGLSQLFVISHDDTFEQATENLIRVEQVNGHSRVIS